MAMSEERQMEWARLVGRIHGLCGVIDMRCEHGWRLIAIASTPGRGDRAEQMERARVQLADAGLAIAEARECCILLHGAPDAPKEVERVDVHAARLRAVSLCWRRHQGEDVPPIHCLCEPGKRASYCEADHTAVMR